MVTGATGGLGYETARALAEDDAWTVVVAGRNPDRVARAARNLREETGGDVTGAPLDLAATASVRRFPDALAERHVPPPHGLVCNAGVQNSGPRRYTEDGYEETFGVNHLGHFLLINLLLPRLPAHARIVLVSSDTHDPRRLTGMPAPRYADAATLADPPAGGDGPGTDARRRYTTSKLCNVLTAYELARRLASGAVPGDPTIRVNAFDPGLMPGSGLARDYPAPLYLAWRYLLPALTVLPGNVHTTRGSGRALARLITDPSLAGVTARYFQGRRPARSSAESYDRAKAADLWRTSAALLGLDPGADTGLDAGRDG